MSNYIYENQNTKGFQVMSWLAFALSTIGMIVGLIYVDADLSTKGFLAMAFLFSITSCFTLAKVIRDQHESEKFLNKVEKKKTEKFLTDFDVD